MVKKGSVPDAWEDDDWEARADKAAAEPPAPAPAPETLSKKERLAQHAELNRKIWESAQEPDNGVPLQFLTHSPAPPLAQPFKAPMQVLSRKPMIARRGGGAAGGMAGLSIRDDSDDEQDTKPPETPEEIRARQQREREEKQRRYDEARAKIFGASNTNPGAGTGGGGRGNSGRSSGASTPGAVTPPRSGSERRGRGRGRGAHRGHNNDRGGSGDYQRSKDASQFGGVSLREEGRQGSHGRELFDPSYAPKPGFALDKKGSTPGSGRSTPRDDEQAFRAPRGPDGGGRGGFGFARRGA
ncbi:uncharacterized protein JN550_003260 [Neoarthrinium moseri]|uniref:uncharacterized protein n=1 Tax=Neoarthrinium moseri TaxID=1658444 RepID=UPI001FDB98BD|nr:uncharacterized protein JN550_003260 [Neoarthrinium moseri]KAI1873007.1 hypothetical protein JN550_003260 [Neoarthrinium moseri]